MGSLYLGGPTIQEVDGKMMMGLSIYGVAVISGSLYSRFYGITMQRRSQVVILDVSKAQVRNKLRHKLNLEHLRLPYIGGYRCFVQSMDSDHQRILLHKPW